MVKFLSLTALLALIAAGLGCSSKSGPKADFDPTLRENFQVPSNSPKLLAAYQPWFGHPGHINVGYNSQDPVVLQKQITQAKSLGIEGFVVNWYGQHHTFEDHAYAALQQTAAENTFQTAVMYDEDTQDPENSTSVVIEDLQYASDHYMGPKAATRNAYLRFDGHPLIFIFPKGTFTDWNRVRQAVSQWDEQPLLIYKDIPRRYAQAFDGFYAWVNPGKPGWQHRWLELGRGIPQDFLLADEQRVPQQTRHRCGLAGLQRFESFLEPQPAHGCALRKDLR